MRLLRSMLFTAILASSPLLGAQGPPKRPAIDGISHMTVYATDPAAARAFYVGELGFAEGKPDRAGDARFYASPKQYIVVAPLPAEHTTSRLKAVFFSTSDAQGLRQYLKSHAIAVPPSVERDSDGTLSFEVTDPEGNQVGFEQAGAHRSLPSAANPTSTRIIHVGFAVRNRAAEDAFYRQILGFRPYWHGGMKEGVDEWVSYQVPDGPDWLEYMLNVGPDPSQRTLGVLNHFSLGVTDINLAATKLEQHGWHETQGEHRQEGKDGKRQLNLFDPDLTRVEYMEFKPFREPCCSAFTAAHPEPSAP